MTPQSHLIEYLEIQSIAILSLVPEVSQDLSGKFVHELRVATRRARAVLWCFSHSSEHLRFKVLDQTLRELGKSLGQIRELDVAILDANHYGINTHKLLRQRKASQNRLRKLVNRDQRDDLAAQFSVALKYSRTTSSISMDEARDKLRSRLSRQLKKRHYGQRRLHRIRITLKKVRYVLEALGCPIEPMKRLQDVLGDAHDLARLRELTGKNAKIKAAQSSMNDKAIRLVAPVLRFAVTQLGGKTSKARLHAIHASRSRTTEIQ